MNHSFEMKRRTVLQLGSAVAGAALAGVGLPNSVRAQEVAATVGRAGIGTGAIRADGGLKVTGAARYAIERQLEGLVYGVAVQSTAPSGRIIGVDTAAAEAAAGVIAVYTAVNAPEIFAATTTDNGGAATEGFTPLRDDLVRYNGMLLAFVVADTFEEATEAAHLVGVEYAPEAFIADLDDPKGQPGPMAGADAIWGDAASAMATAAVTVEAEYSHPRNYTAPIEPHACIAVWGGDRITVWQPSQWVGGGRAVIAEWMGLELDKVQVLSPDVGGGFGSEIAPHANVAIACAASRALNRPVKASLTRQQTFSGIGGRPAARTTLKIGADANGKIVAVEHPSSTTWRVWGRPMREQRSNALCDWVATSDADRCARPVSTEVATRRDCAQVPAAARRMPTVVSIIPCAS